MKVVVDLGGARACVASVLVIDCDRWGGRTGLTGQYEAGLDLGCVECEILLHRYCSCRDPGFASATRAAKTGIRRVDVVFQRGFEDGLTRCEFYSASRAGQRDGHVGLGEVIHVCAVPCAAVRFEVYPLRGPP